MTDCFRWYVQSTVEGDKIVGIFESEVVEYEALNQCKLFRCENPWSKIGVESR